MQSAFLWTLGVCIVLYTTIPVALSASNTSDAGTQDSKNALVDGMKPLYKMTRQFLDIIQPRSKGNVISALGLDLSGEYHVKSTRPDHVNIKAHPKLNPNLNQKRLGFRVRV